MVTVPFNGSRRILGRSRSQIPDDCVSFFARKRANELANLASHNRFREELNKWRNSDDAHAATYVEHFEQVAQKRGITIPVG